MPRTLLSAVVLTAVIGIPTAAQMSGYYGGTGPERRFAQDLYKTSQEKGIEYVSVSFRVATLTLYPGEDLFKSWAADEEIAKQELGDYARRLLTEVRKKKPTGLVKVTVKIRYPNERRSYDRITAVLTSEEGNEGTLELIVK